MVLHERLYKLTQMLQNSICIDLTLISNRKNIFKIFELLNCYAKVKRYFNKAFGQSMLISALFDVIMITVSIYAIITCRKYQTAVILWYMSMFDIVPTIIKNIYLVWTMNLLGKQVKIIFHTKFDLYID